MLETRDSGRGSDLVRESTAEGVNEELDRELAVRVMRSSGGTSADIEARIGELDQEWDVERALETNASVIGLAGLILGITHSKKWLAVPGIVLPFLFQHATTGWCPPLPVLRRLGFRTRKEIDREKYALKAVRGDFEPNDELRSDIAALRAVDLGS